MKKLFTALALILALNSTASAQSTPPANSGAASVSRTEEYCMILATEKFMSNKLTITIDYGQERKYFTDYRYKDSEGKVKTFSSVIDVLNYQNSQGWEFVNAYVTTVASQNVYHYVMKRRITGQGQ